MHASSLRPRCSAVALAAALLLAACGGGDATPPAETTPPTMAIASSVVSGAAVGPVTFTFTFSEDVGGSFTADDVAVTNGTKGAFTKVSATQYTLVVTPSPNATGSVALAVAAGSYADLVGNTGGTASASQVFDTLPPVVAVTSSAAGSTASGDVTLTFAFTKDVGSSFDATDIAVTGGTKGTFTRVDGTRATLVITPGVNAAGNVEVAVAAGTFADASGRTNTAAASLTQAYNTRTGPTLVQVVRAHTAAAPAYDGGKAQPGNHATGNYSANAGEVNWWGGNYPEQIQMGYGFSKTNAAQWGFGLFIQHGSGGWDVSNTTHYRFSLGTNAECAGVCKATARLVSAANPACVADAKVTLTSADINTSYSVKLADMTVSGCTTNTPAAFIQQKVAELHFQLLRADMQFTTSGDPTLFPNGLGIGGNIAFETPGTTPPPTSGKLQIVRANATGSPAYDTTNGKALPANYTTGNYSANAGEAFWWGGNYAEQIQVGYGFSKTNTAQWGFGLFIAQGSGGWDISGQSNYSVTLGTNAECANACKATLRFVSASNSACVADAKVTLTAAAITTYKVPLSSFTVSGCTTNTMAAFKAMKVAELHFQMLRADMQFTTSADPALFPNGLGVGGDIFFD